MRINKYGLLVALLLLAPAAAMAQEARVVAVNTEEAVLKSDAGKAADTKLTAKYEERKKELDKKQKELDDLNIKKRDQWTLLSEKFKEELTRQINTTQTTLERSLEDARTEMDKLRNDELGPIVKVARAELDKLVNEKSYEIVIDLAGDGPVYFVHVSPKINITDELVKRINVAWLKTSSTGEAKPAPAEAKATK